MVDVPVLSKGTEPRVTSSIDSDSDKVVDDSRTVRGLVLTGRVSTSTRSEPENSIALVFSPSESV